MPEPADRKEPVTGEELETRSQTQHPDRETANQERKERELRDREELGRPPAEAREGALAEDVTERRDREAREEAERIEEEVEREQP